MTSPANRELQAERSIIRLPIRDVDAYRQGNEKFDQDYINCFPEYHKNPMTGEGEYVLQKRPGLANGHDIFAVSGAASRAYLQCMGLVSITQLTNQYVGAWWNSNTNVIYIIGVNGLSGHVLIGTIPAACSPVDWIHITECQIANAGALFPGVTITWTRNDRGVSKCYHARTAGGVFTAASLTQITDVDFPDQIAVTPKIVTGPLLQMDGLFYCMTTDGWIYGSGDTAATPNDPSVWNSLTKSQCYMKPDGGVGLYRYKHHIVAVGMDSIEFWTNQGLPPPQLGLARTEAAFINFGAWHSMGVLPVDDTLYWISNSTSGTIGVWKLDGYTPVKISTAKEDRDIVLSNGANAYPADYSLFFLVINGKKHLGVNSILRNNMLRNFTYSAPGQQYIGQSTDTYKAMQYTNIKSSIICYSMEEKVWWSFLHQAGSVQVSTTKLFGAVKYNSTVASAWGDVYFGYGGTNGLVYGSGSRTYGFSSGYSGTYADTSTDVGTDAVPVVAGMTFTPFEFSTMSRKKISKATLVFGDAPNRSGTGTTDVYSFSIIYSKRNRLDFVQTALSEQLLYERPINYTYSPATERFYINNLGMSRYWGFSVVSWNKDTFNLKALELVVQGGTH